MTGADPECILNSLTAMHKAIYLIKLFTVHQYGQILKKAFHGMSTETLKHNIAVCH